MRLIPWWSPSSLRHPVERWQAGRYRRQVAFTVKELREILAHVERQRLDTKDGNDA